MDLAKKRADFLHVWVTARRTCLPRDASDVVIQEATTELDEIRASLKQVLHVAGQATADDRERSFLSRILLAYRPKRLAGWRWRAAFYVWIGAIVLFLPPLFFHHRA